MLYMGYWVARLKPSADTWWYSGQSQRLGQCEVMDRADMFRERLMLTETGDSLGPRGDDRAGSAMTVQIDCFVTDQSCASREASGAYCATFCKFKTPSAALG